MKYIQRIALYLFFFSINFEMWDLFHNDHFSLSKLMGLIYVLILTPQIIKFATTDQNKKVLLPLWFFFGLLTLVNLLNINDSNKNFFDFTIFQNIVLFWILVNHEDIDEHVLEKGMLSFSIGSVALALLYNAGIGIEYTWNGRVSIFGDNQNNIGVRMSISMTILILVAVQNKLNLGYTRYLLLLPIPLMMRFMAETGSRVAFLSFVLAFITGIVLFRAKNVWSKIAVFALGTIAFALTWQFLMQSEVLKLRILLSTQETDLSGRDIIWQNVIQLIKSNPLFGVGETGYNLFAQTTFGVVRSPHNVILEILCYTGITGLLIYSVFLYRIFIRGLKRYSNDRFLLPILLLPFVLSLLLSAQVLNVKISWIIFAYIAASSMTNLNQISQKN